MSNWFTRAFGYGLGSAVGRSLLGDDRRGRAFEPITQLTEEDIRAGERRIAEQEKKLEANSKTKTPKPTTAPS